MNNTLKHAQREIDILLKSSHDPENRPVIEEFIPEILALVEKFGNSGQSGGSAPYYAGAISQAIKKLCLHEVLAPIQGTEDEWNEVGNGVFQNNRNSAIFKKGRDGRSYYIDAIIWKGQYPFRETSEEWNDTFTGRVEGVSSLQYIKEFPFTPKKFYVKVEREQLPEDWNEEPYIEGSQWYSKEEFERTGEKVWHKDNYRYHIIDPKQLEEVFAYYDRFEIE